MTGSDWSIGQKRNQRRVERSARRFLLVPIPSVRNYGGSLALDQLLEIVEFIAVQIRNGPEGHASGGPVN